ncbi:hypothetical protein CDAR_421951 [Caerostris darwini]|uniref:Uncharacterized protein n=1 Tax=Caerostris darwini TaxID=1538125 RepID=A0AAV4VB90_9ARAC|nr:hypothetical protein CDAR_421951 [Caerostris darwini]
MPSAGSEPEACGTKGQKRQPTDGTFFSDFKSYHAFRSQRNFCPCENERYSESCTFVFINVLLGSQQNSQDAQENNFDAHFPCPIRSDFSPQGLLHSTDVRFKQSFQLGGKDHFFGTVVDSSNENGQDTPPDRTAGKF